MRSSSSRSRTYASSSRNDLAPLLLCSFDHQRHLTRLLAPHPKATTILDETGSTGAAPTPELELRTPIARSDPVILSGAVTSWARLGGLLIEYERETVPVAA